MWRLKKYCRDRETGRSHTILFAFTSPVFAIIFFIAYFTYYLPGRMDLLI